MNINFAMLLNTLFSLIDPGSPELCPVNKTGWQKIDLYKHDCPILSMRLKVENTQGGTICLCEGNDLENPQSSYNYGKNRICSKVTRAFWFTDKILICITDSDRRRGDDLLLCLTDNGKDLDNRYTLEFPARRVIDNFVRKIIDTDPRCNRKLALQQKRELRAKKRCPLEKNPFIMLSKNYKKTCR